MYTLTWTTDNGVLRTLGLDEITVGSLLTAAGDLGVDTCDWGDLYVYKLVATLAGGLLSDGEGVVACSQGTVVVHRAV